MIDDALVEPRPNVLDEVFVGDPLQLDNRNPRDVLQSVGDQPTIIKTAEAMLQSVVKSAKQERAANQSPA